MTAVRARTLPGRERTVLLIRLVVPLLLVAVLVTRVGVEPFLLAGRVVAPVPLVAALVLGLVTTAAQALRWRTVVQGHGGAAELTTSTAVQEYYRSAFLNTALPGGVAGDAVRAWRQRGGQGRPALRSAARSVVVERTAGAALLFLVAATAAIRVDLRLSAVLLAVSVAATVVAAPGCARLSSPALVAVLGWSVVALAAILGMFAVAAAALGTVPGPLDVLVLGVILMAGTSFPLGFAGFGPRETVAALTFAAAGLPAESGVATAAAFGVLAVVSVLPGGAVLLHASLRPIRDRPREPSVGQVELDADVVPEVEASGRSAQRVAEPVGPCEPQPRHPVTDQ